MIVISEDVWSDGFAELAKDHTTVHEPDLWSRWDDLKYALASAEALVVRNRTQVNEELFAAAPKLKVVGRAGVGLDNIDIDAANRHGVVVSAALGINAVAVGELTLGLALALLRKVTELDASTRSGEWNRKAGVEITGKTWGMLGFGATARALARLLKGFGVTVIAYDPFAKLDPNFAAETNTTLASLEDVISRSDVISLHMPATPETTKMINSARLASMKGHAIIVNVGRGELIDEEALEDALRKGVIAGAALDVRESEPPKDSRFSDLSNVILTPHIAGITKESQSKINEVLLSEVKAAVSGGSPSYAVGAVKEFKK
ncbi:MAG: hydroxyacid dehydrogenase [Candidatus Nanopelagicaceae bacterium]